MISLMVTGTDDVLDGAAAVPDFTILRETAERVVDGPLRESVSRTDLPPERFIEEAVENGEEIGAEISELSLEINSLKRQIESARNQRSAQAGAIIMVGVGGALALLAFLLGAAIWLVAVIGGIGLLLGTAAFLGTLSEKRTVKAELPTGIPASETQATLEERLEVALQEFEPAIERAVAGWLSERVNQEIGAIYAHALPEVDPQGLAEVDDTEREIATRSGSELDSLFDRMPGGSIGISGPRGAGKSTLIARATSQAGRVEGDRVALGVVVDAPVDYDAREFVLHLFARLCESVLGPDRVDALRNWDTAAEPSRTARPFRSLRSPYPPLLGPLLFLAGAALYVAILDAEGNLRLEDRDTWAIVLMATGGALTYLTLILNPRWIVGKLRSSLPRGKPKGRALATAAVRLRQIWFQRTFSSGWSGSFKMPVGLEAGTERSAQLAENQMSLPDIVSLYKEFVQLIAATGEVRIGIDELDKMEDEQARRFLNEIKVIFRISGCFYLVSVSEDAMSYFERRGLPFRDVFDSSFDDVLRVGYLPYTDSHRLLRRRVVGLPIQFVALCHVIGGGLARDVIRVARDVCEHPAGASLEEVARTLSTKQLNAKCAAARVAVRRLKDPRLSSLLSGWLTKMDAAAETQESMLEKCGTFEEEFAEPLGPVPPDESQMLREHREALSVALEVVTFNYFVATVRDFIHGLESQAATERAVSSKAIDQLGEARQAFSLDPREAWGAISTVRTEYLDADAVPFPPLRVQRPRN